MDKINDGGPGEIPPVHEKTPMDAFENAIRAVGVVNACEWFGYSADSEFTRETIETLIERAALDAALIKAGRKEAPVRTGE